LSNIIAICTASAVDHLLEINGRDALTGMLLYRDGILMQVLKRDHDIVRAIHARVELDPGHLS